MIRNTIIARLACPFGTEALNIRISEKDPISRERIDKHLDRYGHLIRAFVLKRRLLRSQIWPKMHIVESKATEEQHHLSYQKLFGIKKSMRDEMMMAIARNDPSKINSAFIISNFSEDYFKEMIDEYLTKVLVCGKAPSDPQKQESVEQAVNELYRSFYFGEKTTPLERQLEQAYLSAKQYKCMRAEAKKETKKKVLVDQCEWSEREQRILQEKRNWLPTSIENSDLNYRSYFLPLDYPNRGAQYLKAQKLQDWGWVDELQFKLSTSKFYNPKCSQYYDWVQQKLFVRIMNHIKSLQFTSALNIPHDYMIQAQMVQIHFWLVMDRLRKIGTTEAGVLARKIGATLNMEIIRSARSVNLKKSNLLITSLERMLQMNSNILQMHFNRSDLTKDNPYKGIDAMVWSIAFAQKVHRYADEVYLFADYLIQNFNHMQQHSQQDIFNGIIQFDPYLVHPKYRQIIEKVNPPLSPAQFEKQFNSDSPNKDYYYSKVQKQIDEEMPMDRRISPSKINTHFSLAQFIQPFRNIAIKYFSLKTMDYYNDLEEQKKQSEALHKKGTWKSDKDSVKTLHQQFETIQAIKNERRKINSGNQGEKTS